MLYNTTIVIYKNILLVDNLVGNAPRYEVDNTETHFCYFGNDVIKKWSKKEEILVPCVEEENQDWDMILMKLLARCGRVRMESSRIDYTLWNKVDNIFQKNNVLMQNIITHPDIEFEPPSLMGVFKTPHCPKNQMLILPPPQFLGVIPMESKTKHGMAVLNSSLVVKVKLNLR